MIEERCIGPDLNRSKIHPDAEVRGASYLTGSRTAVAAGAKVIDSRLNDCVVESGAEVIDSIFVAEGEPSSHKCDIAGRVVVRGAGVPTVAAGARVSGCTMMNVAVGEGSVVADTWAKDVTFGVRNTIRDAKLTVTECCDDVTVTGPTEVSEAWLGRHATIDRRGYYEGIFSNTFRVLEFDAASGRLKVAETIDLPHVSRYGVNTINSTNSGKLLPQPGGVVEGFGPHIGLWRDRLLSHEQVELGPCSWVVPWTKVIGQSALPHETDEELVNDELMTYLMPFAMAGLDGPATNGLVMPGELSVGFGPKQRKGAWVFTYAPGAVITMVRRLHDALEPDRKAVADAVVNKALGTALAVTEAMAARNGVDLAVPHDQQRRGWPRWIGTTHALLKAHADGGLWEFSGGDPVGWRSESGRWTHPDIEGVLAVAPDALDEQKSEEEIYAFDDPVPPVSVAVPSGAVGGTGGDASIDPGAEVAEDAVIGPGCRVGTGCVIEAGAVLWNSALEDCSVGAGVRVERSTVSGGSLGRGTVVISSRLERSSVGEGSTVESAAATDSKLAGPATVSPFADLKSVTADFGTILGGAFEAVDIDAYLMSMHMAGGCFHMRAVPRMVELDGMAAFVPAIPMLGGGSLIRGTEEEPVELECSFIGSNAIIEPGTFVGFGCFVLGKLGPRAGLLPFTVSTGGGAKRHQIGAVISAMASTAITHFVNWTFQAVGPEGLDGDGGRAVAEMMRQAIAEASAAIEWEVKRRASSGDFDSDSNPFHRYRSLPEYSDSQLESGLEHYRRALDDGAWDIQLRDGQLYFSSEQGHWEERGGAAFWRPKA